MKRIRYASRSLQIITTRRIDSSFGRRVDSGAGSRSRSGGGVFDERFAVRMDKSRNSSPLSPSFVAFIAIQSLARLHQGVQQRNQPAATSVNSYPPVAASRHNYSLQSIRPVPSLATVPSRCGCSIGIRSSNSSVVRLGPAKRSRTTSMVHLSRTIWIVRAGYRTAIDLTSSH